MTRLAYANDNYKGLPTDMVMAASHALLAGACRYVLGVRALYNLPEIDYATPASTYAFGLDQFKTPFGATAAGARFATRATAYLDRAGATRRDLYEVVALARRHAALNPLAVWRDRALSLDEYLAAPDDRIAARPLRLRHAGVRCGRLRHDTRQGPARGERAAGLSRRFGELAARHRHLCQCSPHTLRYGPCANLRRLLLHGLGMAGTARLLPARHRLEVHARGMPTATAVCRSIRSEAASAKAVCTALAICARRSCRSAAGPAHVSCGRRRTVSCRSAPSISPRSSS